ncbi:MAG: hypothetical protein QNJ47_25770 [Nostocaceae cyanobacterium]|nr:hypothetical protein [Nostocaceae cyanobacterium]
MPVPQSGKMPVPQSGKMPVPQSGKMPNTAEIPLRLYQGRFESLRSHQHQGRDLFIQWYRGKIHPKLCI